MHGYIDTRQKAILMCLVETGCAGRRRRTTGDSRLRLRKHPEPVPANGVREPGKGVTQTQPAYMLALAQMVCIRITDINQVCS